MLYVVRGEVAVNGTPVRRRTMVELGTEAERHVEAHLRRRRRPRAVLPWRS